MMKIGARSYGLLRCTRARKDVLERMLLFRLECAKVRGVVYFKGVQDILDGKDKWIIEEAPTNQFYKVGWGSNDTLFS